MITATKTLIQDDLVSTPMPKEGTKTLYIKVFF